MTLQIGPGMRLPNDAVTQKICLLGMSGAGKTNTMITLAEEMLDSKAQVVILDPKGEAWGLRLDSSGKGTGYPIPVFGGAHGDVPLRPEMGGRIAELIVKSDYSAILDLSDFMPNELGQFGYHFATTLLHLKKRYRSAMCLMIDEAQEFMPQNPQPSHKGSENWEPRMLHAFSALQKQGRATGVGMIIAGQRPQEISKRVLNLCEAWIMFRLAGLQERKTTVQLIGEKDREAAARIDRLLPGLETGTAYVWSVYWLKKNEVFHFREKSTFDTSATPKVGVKRTEPRELSPLDIEALTASLEDVIEQAKADDPKALRNQIANLTRQLASRPQTEPITKTVEVPIFRDGEVGRLEEAVKSLGVFAEQIKASAYSIATALQAKPAAPDKKYLTTYRPTGIVTRRIAPPSQLVVSLPKAKRLILTALAQYGPLSKQQIAILTHYSGKGGGFTNALGSLRTDRMVRGSNAHIEITEEGLDVLGPFESLPTGSDMIKHWIQILPKAESSIVRVLVQHYPEAIDKKTLAEEAGYSMKGGGFMNALGRVRRLNLAVGRSEICASDTLMGG